MTDAPASSRDDWPTAGWRSAPPADLGLDERLLAEADRRFRSDLTGVHNFLVARHGRLAYERYYGGHERDDLFSVQSVTKSVTGCLVGIALGDGLLRLDQTVGDLLPGRVPVEVDPRVRAITVRQLLTMTAGFAWDDLHDYWRAADEVDWVRAILATPLANAPGTTFTYNTGCSQVLSTILAAATGRAVADYAAERLFAPLGMTPAAWPTDPQGNPIRGTGLMLTAPDAAKLGVLYANGGRWGNTQVVPAAYVAASTARQSDGGDPETALYGYHWWVTEAAGRAACFAAGYGGQYVYVVPDLDLVVVTTARWQVPPEETPELRPIIEDLVVPAAETPNPMRSIAAGPSPS